MIRVIHQVRTCTLPVWERSYTVIKSKLDFERERERERERESAIHIAVQTFGYGWLFVSEGVGEENPITFNILVGLITRV